jgi:hypothetical protein
MSDAEWRRAVVAYKAADRLVCSAARKALPVGRLVTWMHGVHRRQAEVVWADLLWGYHTSRVRVRSFITGKQYWVPVSTLLRGLDA